MEIILPVDAPMLRCSNIPLHLEKNESTLALMSNSSFRSIFPSPQLLMLKVWSTVSGKSWLLLKLDLTPLKFLGFTLAEAVDWSKRQIKTKFKFDLRNISNRVFNLQWSCSAPVIDRRFATNEVIYLSARIKPWRRLLKTWKWFKFFYCFFFLQKWSGATSHTKNNWRSTMFTFFFFQIIFPKFFYTSVTEFY